MGVTSRTPDIAGIDVPMDAWTEPFWAATADHRLVLPRCADCLAFRWPPGPFCPNCRSQRTQWRPAGAGHVYSYTIVPAPAGDASGRPAIPALIAFPEAGGVRLLAAIVDAPPNALRIGTAVAVGWSAAANATVPVFRLDAADAA